MAGERILVADDLELNRILLREMLEAEGYSVAEAVDGNDAIAAVERDPPDLLLLDAVMPDRDGFSVLRSLKSDPRTRLVPIIMITALTELDDKLLAVSLGVDDFLTKPINAVELRTRVRSLLSLKRFTDELEHASQVLESLAIAIEQRDGYTGQHCRRVGRYAQRVGRELGLDAMALEVLRLGGVFHDIGKITVPDEILRKEDSLDPRERAAMARHVEAGAAICAPMRTLRKVIPVIRHHHERLDGSGYPDGLTGGAIPIAVRIVTVVDIFDALSTRRPYRDAVSPERALETLRVEAAGGWWDAEIVEVFARILARDGIDPEQG